MVTLVILWIEWLLLLVIGIRYIIKFNRLDRSRAEIKQMYLSKTGKVLSTTGALIAFFGPRVLNVRYAHDDQSTLIAVLTYTVGFLVMFIGFQLRLASYKTKEE